ncbi:DMT family transporter [Tropicimonas sp. IMCC6043]|uniref:DMT family transporter n=1 Tax=Tropicimonas sp. IMCC6043 TaxID=2510645 RepID=UPI00101D0635|nr:DMT family transporter [Tropicimonas sp. IMCC6043]RYH10096.1 DMT family transporter [Tropicimonas sp. IMCC6043]
MSAAAEHRPLRAVLWMLVTGVCFVGVQATVKHLGPGIPPAESAFLRYVLGLVLLLPVWPELRRTRLSRRAWTLFTLRGAAQAMAVMAWFYAMTRISLAEVTAMNYMNPIYVTLGAVLFLGEPLAARRLAAIGFAFVGALIILRPGLRPLETGHVAMIFAAFGFSAAYLIAKRMTFEASPGVVVTMMSIMVTLFLSPFALADWVPPAPVQLGWLFLVACFATAGHFAMTLAFREAPMAVSQPATFLQLVWASLLGALAFGEPIDGWVVLGGAIVMAAVSFIAWREMRLKSHPPVVHT